MSRKFWALTGVMVTLWLGLAGLMTTLHAGVRADMRDLRSDHTAIRNEKRGEFELAADEVIMFRQDDRLVLELVSGDRSLQEVLSELIRRPRGSIAEHAAGLEQGSLAISVIVAAELRYCVERQGSTRLARQLEAVLSALPTLPLAEPADRHYGGIRSELERRGRPVGHNDLQIAAHARAWRNAGDEECRRDQQGSGIEGRGVGMTIWRRYGPDADRSISGAGRVIWGRANLAR